MRTETVNVLGIKCTGCAEKINWALLQVSGVQTVEVSIECGTVKILYDDESAGLGQRRARISKLGYGVDDLKLPHGRGGCRCVVPQAA
jgi:copper chaperone CopZ